MTRLRGVFACGLALMMMLALAVVVAPRAQASGSTASSQIALSCQGAPTPPSNANECVGTPSAASCGSISGAAFCFSNIGGFWVWCETPSASNGYKGECNGAIYQEELTAGVFAYQVASMTGDATPGSNGAIKVTVGTSTVAGECVFTVSPSLTRGQSNAIPAACIGTVNFGTGTTTGAFTVGVDAAGKFVGAIGGFNGAFSPGVAVIT